MLLAIAGTTYGHLLRRHATGDARPRLGVVALVGALVTVTLFWQTERLARYGGKAIAQDIKDHLAERLPSVSLYSVERLHVSAPGVTERDIGGPDSAYRYLYEGLYLLQRSGRKYFLLTDGWSERRGRLVVLADTESVRLEFGGRMHDGMRS